MPDRVGAGRRRWTHSLGAVVALVGALLSLCAQVGGAAQITGIADENLAGWDPFAMSIFDAMNVPQVRHVVPWNVALDPDQVDQLHQWIGTARAHGKQVLISFGAASSPLPAPTCAPGDPSPCPNGNYRFAIDRFRAVFPDVTEFTAWNEPNHPLSGVNPTPDQAAGYWNQLDAACQIPSSTGQRCTVAAGDFSDFNSLTSYVEGYRPLLHRIPDVWAVHTYNAINPDSSGSTSAGVQKLTTYIANETDINKPIWITEVGAYYCTMANGTPPNAAAVQDAAAANLNALMASPALSRVNRVYYYFLASGAGRGARCPTVEDDPTLIGGSDVVRPALTTLFPSLHAPSVQTGGASSLRASRATFNGTVDGRGLPTAYHFEYGLTTAYGSSTADTNAGTGARTPSQSAEGLLPERLYHYRLIATNPIGTTFGPDRTYTTANPSLNGDGKADLVVGSNNGYGVDQSLGTSFGNGGVWETGYATRADFIRTADFNGDGRTDLLVGNGNVYAVDLSSGDRFGAQGSAVWETGYATRADFVGTGDFNGDGKTDLIVGDGNTYSVDLSTGTRFGASGSGVWATNWATTADVIRLADFNGDGRTDLLVGNGNVYAVDLSNGTGFGNGGVWETGYATKADYIDTADFNGDGKTDLIVGDGNVYAVDLSDGSRFGTAGSGVWQNGWATLADFITVG